MVVVLFIRLAGCRTLFGKRMVGIALSVSDNINNKGDENHFPCKCVPVCGLSIMQAVNLTTVTTLTRAPLGYLAECAPLGGGADSAPPA